MTRFLPLLVLSFAGFVFFAGPASAQEAKQESQIESYKFDKNHTQILFFADHVGFAKSSGRFMEFDGGFTFDRARPENSKIDVTINTASINMAMERWDEHLKNADFFNVEKFPAMTFKSTGIKVTGENTADITGDLTMLGVTKPVTMQVTHNKSGVFPMNNEYHAGFSATAKIDRSQWGMTYGLPMMSPEVEIRIEVEGVREGGTTNQ